MSGQPTHFMSAHILDSFGQKVGDATFAASLDAVRTVADVDVLNENVTRSARDRGDLPAGFRYAVTGWSEFAK